MYITKLINTSITIISVLYFLSCNIETPNAPERDNPLDEKNPNAVPKIISVIIGNGSGYSNNPVTIFIKTQVSSEITICEVPDSNENLTYNWHPIDTAYYLNISPIDTKKWIGCKTKALNEKESEAHYTSFFLDTHCSIDTFLFFPTTRDTLYICDKIKFILKMKNDIYGSEIEGKARVSIEGISGYYLLKGLGNGIYSGTIEVGWNMPALNSAKVNVLFTDRAGNTSSETLQNRTITIEKEWMRTFGGNDNDYGYSVQKTRDGGFIFSGFLNGDFVIIKTDEGGNTQWIHSYEDGPGICIRQTNDLGYIILSSSYLTRTDSLGTVLWRKDCGPGSKFMDLTIDGGFIITGFHDSGSQRVSFLTKINELGNEEWNRYFSSDSWPIDYMAYSVQENINGGFILGGFYVYFDLANYRRYLWLVKTDEVGSKIWVKAFDCGLPEYNKHIKYLNAFGYAQQTIDGDFIIAGNYRNQSEPYDYDIRVVKTNTDGTVERDLHIHDIYAPQYKDDFCRKVKKTLDGCCIIIAESNNDMELIKLDNNINIVWRRSYGDLGMDVVNSVEQTFDEGYILIGSTESFGNGGSDICLLRDAP